jgi:myo-inositol 2-dehydrogenase / D-chiro-inositol 1-dehydrogenase
MIRLGLIGCGEHSEIGHAIPLARYRVAHPGEIELVAACDPRIDRAQDFCRRYGFANAYSKADEMLAAERFDGCIAVVPVDKIFEVGIKLLRLHVPCVVEKPLGVSLREVKILLDTARATRTPNMVSVNRRFMPYLNRAIHWTRSAGVLRYVRCTIARHARLEPDFLWTTAVHAVDALRHIGGEVTDAKMQSLKSDGEAAEWYAIDLCFESGVMGRIDVLPTAGMLEETYELIGNGFRATVTCPFGPERGWRCFQGNRVVSKETVSDDMAEDILNGFYDEGTEFIRALTMKDTPRPSMEDVFPSVEICFTLAKNAIKAPGFESRRKSR